MCTATNKREKKIKTRHQILKKFQGYQWREEERRLLCAINGHSVREEGGEMGFSMEAVVVGGGGWGRPLWQGRERGETGREGSW